MSNKYQLQLTFKSGITSKTYKKALFFTSKAKATAKVKEIDALIASKYPKNSVKSSIIKQRTTTNPAKQLDWEL